MSPRRVMLYLTLFGVGLAVVAGGVHLWQTHEYQQAAKPFSTRMYRAEHGHEPWPYNKNDNVYLPGLNTTPAATKPDEQPTPVAPAPVIQPASLSPRVPPRNYRHGDTDRGWILSDGTFFPVGADVDTPTELDALCGYALSISRVRVTCVEGPDHVVRFVPVAEAPVNAAAAEAPPQTHPSDEQVRSIWTTTPHDWRGNWVGNANERPPGEFWTCYPAAPPEAPEAPKAPAPASEDLFPSSHPTTQPADSATPSSAPRTRSDDDLDAGIAEWQKFFDLQSGRTKQKVFTTDDGLFPDAESTTRPASKTEATP